MGNNPSGPPTRKDVTTMISRDIDVVSCYKISKEKYSLVKPYEGTYGLHGNPNVKVIISITPKYFIVNARLPGFAVPLTYYGSTDTLLRGKKEYHISEEIMQIGKKRYAHKRHIQFYPNAFSITTETRGLGFNDVTTTNWKLDKLG